MDSVAFTRDFGFNITMGEFPSAIAFTPDGRWAYIVCMDSDNVVLVNASSLGEETAIEVGDEPFAIDISADGAMAYITNHADGTVSVIDTSTGEIETTISVGSGPRDITISRDGRRAYVCLSGEDSVAVIDTDSMMVDRKIIVGRGPWGVDVTTDDRRLYVSCNEERMLYVVDLDGDEIVEEIYVRGGPRGVSIIPGAQRVYVMSTEVVVIIDTERNSEIDASGIHGNGWEGVVRPDGEFIFVSTIDHPDGIVEVIDISRMEKIESIWLGEGNMYPRGIAIRPLLSSGMISTSITCLGPESVILNSTLTISGCISPPLQGREVTLVYKDPSSVPISRKSETDSNGAYIDNFSPQKTGNWEVTASWDGDEGNTGATSPTLSFTVKRDPSDNAGPFPLLIIIAMVIIVVLVLKRRRGRKNP
jgi:YVTN family beta-propeller protein